MMGTVNRFYLSPLHVLVAVFLSTEQKLNYSKVSILLLCANVLAFGLIGDADYREGKGQNYNILMLKNDF